MTVAAGRVLERWGFVGGDVRVGGLNPTFLLPLREKVPPEKGADEGAGGERVDAARLGSTLPLIRQAPPDTFSPGGEKDVKRFITADTAKARRSRRGWCTGY